MECSSIIYSQLTFLLHLSEFLQYEEFVAYVSVKAGSLYCLLKNVEAKSGGKEAFMSEDLVDGF